MAYRFRHRQQAWTEQPQEITEAAQSWRARGLTSLLRLDMGLDLASQKSLDYAGASLVRSQPFVGGNGARWPDSPADLCWVSVPGNPFAHDAFSVAAVIYPTQYPPDAATIFASSGADTSDQAAQFRLGGSGQLQLVRPGVALVRESSLIAPLNKISVVGCTFRPGPSGTTVANFYLDGVEDAATGFFENTFNHGSVGCVGANFNSPDYNFRGWISMLAYGGEAFWTAADQREIAANPNSLFESRRMQEARRMAAAVPTLSAALLTSITTTTARPQVTLTF